MSQRRLSRTAIFPPPPTARERPALVSSAAIDTIGDGHSRRNPLTFGAPVVDDSSCLRYFLEPDDTLHRRYEALRAYFVQGCPLQEIATQFGYTYDTLRQVIHQFRTRCRSGTSV